jgi:hypothetical protein
MYHLFMGFASKNHLLFQQIFMNGTTTISKSDGFPRRESNPDPKDYLE